MTPSIGVGFSFDRLAANPPVSPGFFALGFCFGLMVKRTTNGWLIDGRPWLKLQQYRRGEVPSLISCVLFKTNAPRSGGISPSSIETIEGEKSLRTSTTRVGSRRANRATSVRKAARCWLHHQFPSPAKVAGSYRSFWRAGIVGRLK